MPTAKLIEYSALATSLTAADQARAEALAAGTQALQVAADAQVTVEAQVQKIDTTITQQAVRVDSVVAQANLAASTAESASVQALLAGGHIQHVVDDSAALQATPAAVGELALTLDTMTVHRVEDGVGWVEKSTAPATTPEVPRVFGNVAEMRAYTGPARAGVLTGTEQSGVWVRDSTVTVDDGYTTVAAESGGGGWRKLGEISIEEFRRAGDASWSAAFRRAIEFANERGGSINFRVPAQLEPRWCYEQLPPVLADFVYFLGDGYRATNLGHGYAGVFIQYGTPATDTAPAVAPTGGGVLNCGIVYPAYQKTVIERPINPHPTVKRTVARPGYKQPIPADKDQWIAFWVAAGVGQVFDVYMAGGFSLIKFGSDHHTGWGNNCRLKAFGYVRNVGVPLMRITSGSMFQYDVQMTLDVEPPVKEWRYKDPVNRTGEYLHIEPGMAEPGATYLLLDERGTSDTIEAVGKCMAQNFWKKIEVLTGPGYYTMNTIADHITGDNTTSTGIDLNPSEQGVVSRFIAAYGYDQSWNDAGIRVRGQGMMDLIDFSHARIFNTAYSGFVWENPRVTNMSFPNLEVFSTNMEPVRNPAFPNLPAVQIGDGCNGWNGANTQLNKSRAHLGDTWSADIGLEIGECEDYVLDGTMTYGKQGGFRYKRKKADGTPVRASRRRSYRGGIIENWHQHERLLETLDSTDFDLKSGSIWRNNTPFIVTVSVGGGTVQDITRGSGYEGEPGYTGYPTGRTDGEFTLNPGEWISITWSNVPVININAVR